MLVRTFAAVFDFKRKKFKILISIKKVAQNLQKF